MSNQLYIYIHWPFCRKKCRYCDFVSLPEGIHADHARYLEALTKELAYRITQYDLTGCSLQTIYLGGGTPSLLNQNQLRVLIERLNSSFSGHGVPEITLEVNPSTVTRDSLDTMFESGVNRLSVGIQTFQERYLGFLGRSHTVDENRNLLGDLARREPGIPYSVDLIYGIPYQDLSEWREDLEEALEYRPVHVSIYNLTIHPGVPLARYQRLHPSTFPGSDREAAMFEWTMDRMADAGYIHYEISNFALPGHQSRHNQAYWRNDPTLGLGLGAWSFLAGRREKNAQRFSQYLARIDHNLSPAVFWEQLEPAQHARETFLLALRTNRGGDLSLLSDLPENKASELALTIESLQSAGFVVREGTVLFLSRKGILVADQVLQELID